MADTAEPPGPPGPELTRAQLAILEAIRKLAEDHGGRPPSMREVNRELGRSSPGGLSYQYSVLEGLGYLRRDPGCVRTVQVRLPGEPPFPVQAGEPAPPPLAAGSEAGPSAASPEREAGPSAAGPGREASPEREAGPSAAGPGREPVAWVPIGGQVAAGVPILPAEPHGDRLPLPREMVGTGTLFALRVVGDSMIGVGIVDGDWVVIREQPEAENGEIVAALIDGIEVEGTVKTLRLADGHRWLMPQNPRYTPIPGDHAEIRGKVVAVLRQV